MPMSTDARAFQEKHARRLKASLPDVRSGVERVTESPTEKAALAQDKYLLGIQEAVTSGKWAAGLRRVSLSDWKDKMINKGINRISGGIDAAADKVVAFAQDLLPFEASLQAQIEGMPDMTLEDSIGRVTAWMRGMTEFRRSG